MPRTATAARIRKVSRYTTDSGAETGRSGPMMRVTMPPTTASSASRVWIRPPRVGSTSSCLPLASGRWSLRLLVPCPAQPLLNRAEWSDPGAESAPGQIVGDLLGSHLQPEEGVHAREVAAERRRARGVDHARAAARAAQFEGALDVQAAKRVTPGPRVGQQVGEHPVLGNVGLEPGAVDHEVRGDLDHAVLGLDATDDLAVLQPHFADRASQRAVPASLPALLHLRLP